MVLSELWRSMPKRTNTCAFLTLRILLESLFLYWIVLFALLLFHRLPLVYDALNNDLSKGLLRPNPFKKLLVREFDIPVEVESSYDC